MSVSKRIQINKEKGKKIGEIEVAKNLLEVGVPQATGIQDLKANGMFISVKIISLEELINY